MRRITRTAALLILCALPGSALAGPGTNVTGNKFLATSLSENVNVSCGAYSMDTTTGVISIWCNKMVNGEVRQRYSESTADIDDEAGCGDPYPPDQLRDLSWDKTNLTSGAANLDWNIDSTGGIYIIEGECFPAWKTTLKLNDGYKNSNGSITAR